MRNFRGVVLQTGLSANLDLLRAVAVLLVLAQHLIVRFHWADKLGIATPPIGTFGGSPLFRTYLSGPDVLNGAQ
jgi:peptidoglycan/LPS O-acetylase OafA/YrhL